jgi:N-acetylglucosamine kinase-like BadF-type ATPase
MSEAILAVDGGNSKADVALVGLDGTLLGAVRGPTISHQVVPIDEASRRLRVLAESAGRPSPTELRLRLAVHALAGADYPQDVRLLERAFAAAVPADAIEVVNDTFGALRAGTTRPWGIVLICGQGVNGAAVSARGTRHRFAGIGALSGDWGGGSAVGMAGLGAAVRGRDGRGPRTELERTISATVGFGRPEAVSRAYYDGRLDPARIGELAPTVFATAAGGDEVARGIVDRLADELAAMARALARRSGLVRSSPDVVLAGGVFRTDDAGFHERLAAAIQQAIPGARLVRLVEPPVLGAALMALDRLADGQADRQVEARIRSALRAWNATPTVVEAS